MAETLLLWALVIAAVVLVVRHRGSPAARAPRDEGLLAERYARGEIDDAEYQQRITLLRQNR